MTPDRDRLDRLEYDIARIARQLAGLPVRLAKSGGGGGSSDLSEQWARVVVAIPAATGHLSDHWGQAEAALSMLDDDTGEEIDPENPQNAANRWDQVFIVDSMVLVDTGHTPHRIKNGTCFEFVDWDDVPDEES